MPAEVDALGPLLAGTGTQAFGMNASTMLTEGATEGATIKPRVLAALALEICR